MGGARHPELVNIYLRLVGENNYIPIVAAFFTSPSVVIVRQRYDDGNNEFIDDDDDDDDDDDNDNDNIYVHIFRYLNSHCNIDKNDSDCLFYFLLGVYNEQGHYKTAQRMLSEAKMLCCDVAKQCMISATIAEILDKTVWILSFYFHDFLVFS